MSSGTGPPSTWSARTLRSSPRSSVRTGGGAVRFTGSGAPSVPFELIVDPVDSAVRESATVSDAVLESATASDPVRDARDVGDEAR